MTEKQRLQCHSIIHFAALAAASVGAGFAQIPGSDNAVIVPIKITMTISLGAVFGISIDKSTAKATIATTTASMIGRAISQYFVGWIPLYGNIVNATTAATLTETTGWAIANFFSHNKLIERNVSEMKLKSMGEIKNECNKCSKPQRWCGKTTVALNIAHELSGKGYRILTIDLDDQCDLTKVLLEKVDDDGIAKALKNQIDVQDTIYTTYDNLDIILGSRELIHINTSSFMLTIKHILK